MTTILSQTDGTRLMIVAEHGECHTYRLHETEYGAMGSKPSYGTLVVRQKIA